MTIDTDDKNPYSKTKILSYLFNSATKLILKYPCFIHNYKTIHIYVGLPLPIENSENKRVKLKINHLSKMVNDTNVLSFGILTHTKLFSLDNYKNNMCEHLRIVLK